MINTSQLKTQGIMGHEVFPKTQAETLSNMAATRGVTL